MKKISLTKIKKELNKITYEFSSSSELSQYFSTTPFFIEYPDNIERVPDSIAAIPFVCNVLPIIWLTDSVLEIKAIDRDFYECIPNVRKAYEKMFPESDFGGEVVAEYIEDNTIITNKKSAAFFSGGLDAVHTLINHIDEKPDLISIWGSDILFDNVDGWAIVHNAIAETARKYNLEDTVIRSSFRRFDNEGVLDGKFSKQLKDGWWHGIKHSLGLLGHAAPYAYIKEITTIYIASSNCSNDEPIRCASHPSVDNNICFFNCKVVHDGFVFSRQDKVKNVVKYSGDIIPLHVCWESQSGGNCCKCEKCYRTISALIAEGADPIKYGFSDSKKTIPLMEDYLVYQKKLPYGHSVKHWTYISASMKKNKSIAKKSPYWKYVKWITKTDFYHPEKFKTKSSVRTIRGVLSQFVFYQKLHDIKEKIHG